MWASSVKERCGRALRPARPTGIARPTKTVATTASAKPQRRRVEALAEHRHREQHRQERLDQLHLADPHRAAERQAAVPGEEAEPHREHRDVGEAAPGRGARRLRRPGRSSIAGSVSGRLHTSTQQITRSAGIVAESRAPAT